MKTTATFMNDPAVFIENEHLSAVILPKRGGKTASLQYKKTGMELLYQNRNDHFKEAEFGSDFSRFEACGFDDAFPGINAEEFTYKGQTFQYPDHGEIWSASMERLDDSASDEVILFYQSSHFHYSYTKRFRLDGSSLVCSYRIINDGESDLPAFWTMHCLVNITPQMRFVFPEQVKTVRNVLKGEWLSVPDGFYSFPTAWDQGKKRCLDALPQAGIAKYYVEGRCPEGEVGYDYPETGTKLRLHYDRKKLPYLGLWITNGGYRGEKNAALEPSSGFYDGLNICRRVTGSIPVLRPGEKFCFDISLNVGDL